MRRRGADLVSLSNGEAVPQSILLVQVLQQLAVHPVLYGVHHLRLRQHCPSLLLYAVVQELRVEGNLSQSIQYLQSKCHSSGGCVARLGRDRPEFIVDVCTISRSLQCSAQPCAGTECDQSLDRARP